MSNLTHQPDLIISLSRDKVTLHLLELPEKGRSHWKTTFDVDGLFLEEQISRSLDQALTDHPELIDQFPCVEMIILDRPNITIPRYYVQNETAAEIAARYLRVRAGDTLTTDDTGDDSVLCYTMPSNTLMMMKEYYANVGVTHLLSLLWQSLSANQQNLQNGSVTYFTVLQDLLIVLASKNGKLIFSKNFNIRDEADLFYYTIACSRMLNADKHWLVSIENEGFLFEMPGDSILKMDHRLSLPSLSVLMGQYKLCGS